MLDRVFREEWGRVLASLVSFLGDFELAEEAAQDAFAAAAERWPRDGVPTSPAAWLITTGRRRAIDRIRRERTLAAKARLLDPVEGVEDDVSAIGDDPIPDERLELLFMCCHPALATDAQVALTLRSLGGLSNDEIARAFLVAPETMKRRLSRAREKIRLAGIPFSVPPASRLPQRLAAVLAVVYLIFNEGYSASAGDSVVRHELCNEAIRLGEVLQSLMPEAPEVIGLLALMLLHDSRRSTRIDRRGDLVLLPDQDRSKWDRGQIARGLVLVEKSLRASAGHPGQYALQAAIAALHAESPSGAETDWPQIAALYGELLAVLPTPIVSLNRAVAVCMADGPAAALGIVEALSDDPALSGTYLLHATRADLLRRLGRTDEAVQAYRRAFELAPTAPERAFLERRRNALASDVSQPSAE